jgi:hypothetical protein
MTFFRSPSLFRNYFIAYVMRLTRTNDGKQLLWPALAAYVARQNTDDTHEPVLIRLIIRTKRICLPGETDGSGSSAQLACLSYKVLPGDLVN